MTRHLETALKVFREVLSQDAPDTGVWSGIRTIIASHDALTSENERLRALCWMARREFNAIRARHGAPVDHYGIVTVDPDYWSIMTNELQAAAGYSTPWPSPEHKLIIDAIITKRDALKGPNHE